MERLWDARKGDYGPVLACCRRMYLRPCNRVVSGQDLRRGKRSIPGQPQTTETTMSDMNITAQRGHTQALAFARKGGAALSTLLHNIHVNKAAERRGAISMMLFLTENFDDSEQAAIPVVGSKIGETGNLPYDHYTVEVTTDSGKRKVNGSWFTDAVKATDEWADLNARISVILGTEAEETIPEIYRELIRLRKTGAGLERVAEYRDAISDMRTGLTKGAMLKHHVDEIMAINPERINVKMPWRLEHVFDAEGRVVLNEDGTDKKIRHVYGSKIRVFDPAKEEDDKVYSVSSFLSLKPEAIGEDKTLTGLDKTGTRPPKTPDATKTAAVYPVPTTLEMLLSCLNSISAGLDISNEAGVKLNSVLLAALGKKGKDGDETTISVCSAALALDHPYSTANKRYDAINVEKAKAAAGAGVRTLVAAKH